MSETVFLTGASGFIAKHIAVKLLAAGYSVVGSVRSIERGDEVRAAVQPHVSPEAAERLRFVALDLEREEGWDTALTGCDVLMHTASPFPMSQPKDEAAIITPAVDGTLRALRAAKATGIQRVILTSSSVSIMNTTLPAGRDAYTEEDWTDINHPAATPYVKSKTLAERAAWDFVRDTAPEIALTVINPVFVLGRPLDDAYGTSVRVIERLMKAADPALPRFGFPTVDVRDVAEAHVRALTMPETAGRRYLVADRFIWFSEMAEILKAAYPDRKIVTRQAPSLLVRFLSLFDPSIKTILPLLGRRDDVSNARARKELGLEFVDVADSVRASAAYLVERSLV